MSPIKGVLLEQKWCPKKSETKMTASVRKQNDCWRSKTRSKWKLKKERGLFWQNTTQCAYACCFVKISGVLFNLFICFEKWCRGREEKEKARHSRQPVRSFFQWTMLYGTCRKGQLAALTGRRLWQWKDHLSAPGPDPDEATPTWHWRREDNGDVRIVARFQCTRFCSNTLFVLF